MRWRHLLVCLGLLLLLAGPTVALAQGGGSAGDQQYTDPFGSTTHSSTHTQTQTQQTSTSPPVTTPADTSTVPAGADATTPAGTDTSSGPVATAATNASGSGSGKTLPYTGLDLWTVVGVGLTLMASGLLIRIRSRRA